MARICMLDNLQLSSACEANQAVRGMLDAGLPLCNPEAKAYAFITVFHTSYWLAAEGVPRL